MCKAGKASEHSNAEGERVLEFAIVNGLHVGDT